VIWVLVSALLNVAAGLLMKAATAGGGLPMLRAADTHVLVYLGLAVLAYGGAFVGYFMAMSHFPLSLAYISIVALTAVGLSVTSWLIWNETLSASQILGFAVALLGLFLINRT
jgi:multidrug transporter EmrE-like cation transporter